MTRLRVLLALATLAALGCSPALARASFGIESGSLQATAFNRDGSIDTQAGSHPYAYTVRFALNHDAEGDAEGSARNIVAVLPAGLIGDRSAVPRCPRSRLEGVSTTCPGDSQVGVAKIAFAQGHGEATLAITAPLYNLAPPAGAAASFGFESGGFVAIENATVTERQGVYRIAVTTANVSKGYLLNVAQTIWGVPADKGHDPERTCASPEGGLIQGCASELPPAPFLTLPTSCTDPMSFLLEVSSTEAPREYFSETALARDEAGSPQDLSGCERLSFEPQIKLSPDTTAADAPAGLTAQVKVDQQGLETPEGLSAADLKDTTVVLPEGVAINPGQAAGLQACPYQDDGIGGDGPPSCPNASRIGTVKVKTPLLEEALEGDVYLLPANPPNIEILIAPADPAAGVYLKLVGHVHLDETTGRLTTTFSETPQLPFTSFTLSFNGGAQAALSTPLRCGTYASRVDFTPWSTPSQPDYLTGDSFAIQQGAGGAPCPSGALPFAPQMVAGASTDQAGGYTSFSLLLTRPDGQQRVDDLRFQAPKGLVGALANVALCPEPQASQGRCPSTSQIGHTVVEAGPGPYPLVVPQPGAPAAPIYLTGPYEGAPFGLSIVTPVVAGPFNLGTIVTRARIEVDGSTAQIVVTTDKLPQTVDGVPTDLRAIDAVIDRPSFMVNPTSCTPMSFAGAAAGEEGASAPVSSRFQVGSCGQLAFKPSFKAATSGKPTRKLGESLYVKLSMPSAPQGTMANIAKVKVDLPKQLPSNLATLQKACVDSVFETDPAACPAPSVVGMATATTPILPVPMSGPVYFVSHGARKFPDLVIVLQGYGVTVDLRGETFISKKGLTSTTFRAIPDVPVGTFELHLPQGRYAALFANGDVCQVKGGLKMPTSLVAQNGMTIHQSTKIAVSGCPKPQGRHHRKRRGRGAKRRK